MGWFSRKNASKDTKPRKRVTTSNDAEIRELKVRARRRLLGSVVLILFAIIFVPLMFDDPKDAIEQNPVVLPADIPQIARPEIIDTDQLPDIAENEVKLPENTQEAIEVLKAKSETAAKNSETEKPVATADPIAEIVKQNQAEPTTTATPKPAPEAKPKPEIVRSDDGSEALALLQGLTPNQSTSQANTSTPGNFILQIAAYSTQQDANLRRDKLIESGISNAYVEQANSNGKTTYRLRIGSFKTRQAAQAAQTRIRALGYDNSLLISQ